jgi:hypothetical protein
VAQEASENSMLAGSASLARSVAAAEVVEIVG